MLSRPWSRACRCGILPRINSPISRFPDSALILLVSQQRTAGFISATTLTLPEPPEASRCHGGCVHSQAAARAGFPSQQMQWSSCGRAVASGAVSRGHAPPGSGEERSERGCAPGRREAAGLRAPLHPGVPCLGSLLYETRAEEGAGSWGLVQPGCGLGSLALKVFGSQYPRGFYVALKFQRARARGQRPSGFFYT